MAKQVQKQKRQISQRKTKVASKPSVDWNFPLEKKNFMILGVGLIVILLGYAAMSMGLGDEAAIPDGSWNSPMAISIGPMLLVIGYCVIIPYGIYKFFGKSE